MKILVTGSQGFVGKNLVCALKNIADGKDRTHPDIAIDEIFEFDLNTDKSLLKKYCAKADFVFNFAGVNRPKEEREFMEGNCGFLCELLNCLRESSNNCPVMLASSVQATLCGRFKDSAYGKSKLKGEEILFDYGRESGAKVLVYRFPNIFGKWCKPSYNSAVATFCYNTANDLPICINDESVELELLYIDDLVCEMINALENREHKCDYDGDLPLANVNGKFCYAPITYRVTLGRIEQLLNSFKLQPSTITMPEIPAKSFEKKLLSTYLSYLPKEKIAFDLDMNTDERGSFTEILKTMNCGQFSVNISKPGVTKGQHWHNTKWEFFIVVSGHALIRERNVNSHEVVEFEVTGERIQAVHMLPGYTHSITNLSQTENLVTVMWANEIFNLEKPDTFFEEV